MYWLRTFSLFALERRINTAAQHFARRFTRITRLTERDLWISAKRQTFLLAVKATGEPP